MFGADQPGLVAELTQILYEEEANLGDADMTRIGGTFAFILSFSLPEQRRGTLQERLDNFSDQKQLTINTAEATHFQSDWGTVEPDTIVSVYGADQPGIVYRVSETLAQRDINICNLHSALDDAEDLYIMTLEVRRPDGMSLEELQDELSEVGHDLDVDISVREYSETPL